MKRRNRQKPTVQFKDKDGKVVHPEMKFYLERGRVPGTWQMYVCRGEMCPRGNAHRQLAKHRCPDCVLADEKETLGQLQYRIAVLSNQ